MMPKETTKGPNQHILIQFYRQSGYFTSIL